MDVEINEIKELKQAERQLEDAREEQIDERLEGMPDRLESIHDDVWQREKSFKVASKMIKMATKLIKDVDANLDLMRRRSDWGVEWIFKAHVPGHEGKKSISLKDELKDEEFVVQLAQHDEDWDKAMSAAYNAFDNAGVDSISKLRKARADWMMAVRNYETESRNAWTVFKARAANTYIEIAESCNDPYQEARYYKLSSAVSEDLKEYIQSRAEATAELSTAFGTLVGQLADSSNDVANGEAAFIGAEQTASEAFWSGVLTDLEAQS